MKVVDKVIKIICFNLKFNKDLVKNVLNTYFLEEHKENYHGILNLDIQAKLYKKHYDR
jgi:hypothetical protein